MPFITSVEWAEFRLYIRFYNSGGNFKVSNLIIEQLPIAAMSVGCRTLSRSSQEP